MYMTQTETQGEGSCKLTNIITIARQSNIVETKVEQQVRREKIVWNICTISNALSIFLWEVLQDWSVVMLAWNRRFMGWSKQWLLEHWWQSIYLSNKQKFEDLNLVNKAVAPFTSVVDKGIKEAKSAAWRRGWKPIL